MEGFLVAFSPYYERNVFPINHGGAPPAGILRGLLGRRLLASCEVAVEYWLALSGTLPASLDEAAAHPALADQLQVRCGAGSGAAR